MSLLLERTTSVDVVDRVVDAFLEDAPAWAAARRPPGGALEVVERERGVHWTLSSQRIATALQRLSSESLKGVAPGDPAIKAARFRRIPPAVADTVIQVALFGEIEYS